MCAYAYYGRSWLVRRPDAFITFGSCRARSTPCAVMSDAINPPGHNLENGSGSFLFPITPVVTARKSIRRRDASRNAVCLATERATFAAAAERPSDRGSARRRARASERRRRSWKADSVSSWSPTEQERILHQRSVSEKGYSGKEGENRSPE